MARSSFANRLNLELIENLYQSWKKDAESVDDNWQAFFEGLEFGSNSSVVSVDSSSMAIIELIDAYRSHGHFSAHIDPLTDPPEIHPDLQIKLFGFDESHLDRLYDTSSFLGSSKATLKELLGMLKQTYCQTIGVEFMHIQDHGIRTWLKGRMEPRRNEANLPLRQRIRVLMTLHFAELFEKFLHTRFVGQKRFSLEGAETLIPILDALAEKGPSLGVKEYVIGMAHRGRLNVLANILHKPYQEIFAEFEDSFQPNAMQGDGDVKYHLGFSSDYITSANETVHLSLTPNPSHLEAVNPVVEGRTRAKQRHFGDTGRRAGIPLLIHGDAAFAGQGIVAETLNLAYLEGYTTGGTIHIVTNNQIGFTTSPTDARSTLYCTDVAKMIQAPIFHVNAEDPEACVYVAELALEFRQQFNRDVVIDMVCYRKHGHNEGDEPTFTQPLMYQRIEKRQSITEIYTQNLIRQGALKPEEAEAITREFQERLRDAHQEIRVTPPNQRGMKSFMGMWSGLQSHYSHTPVATNVPKGLLHDIGQKMTAIPEGFQPNPKITQLMEKRRQDILNDRGIDWPTGELLAFGTLMQEGQLVRLSGQDVGRGTFSQRHCVIVDANTGARFAPLDQISSQQSRFAVYDSLLSEAAVLGFEFGYSLDSPHSLVLWEAQFGDFCNGAQSIIDQFIVCSETKWQRSNSLVMLLPHGYEGQGPEHSSARLERFLQACAEDNIQVCNITTPAQYFHALRRQLKRNFRKPLIIMTPKSLLRHKQVVSPISDFTDNCFVEVLDDVAVKADAVTRLIFCSGKIYYDLLEERTKKQLTSIALIRVEQLYPFPELQIQKLSNRYLHTKEWFWVQEESQNMGAWTFMEPRFRAMGYPITYVGRDASASPAVGSYKLHANEQKAIVEAALTAANTVKTISASYAGNGFSGNVMSKPKV